MTEEEIIQEIEKLELEEEKEKTVKYLLKVVIEGKKDIIQEKEIFLEKKEKEIEELKEENIELINQRTEGYWENDRLKKEIETLKETHKEFLKLHQELKAEDTLLGTDNILNAIEKNILAKIK